MKTFYLLLMTGALCVLLLNRRMLHKKLHLFIPLLILALMSDGFQSWPGEEHPLSRIFFALYTPAEYTLQCLVIAAYLQDTAKRRLVLRSIPVFVLAALVIQVWLKEQNVFFTYFDVLIQGPLICLWTVFYFMEKAQDEQDISGWREPFVIISMAHLIFFTTGLISYGLRSYYTSRGDEESARSVSWIAKAGNLLMYSLYLTAFTLPWLKKRRKYSQ